MINHEENPRFLNDFLNYSSTILNKSQTTMKEYNYDLNHFLKFIKYKFNINFDTDEDNKKKIKSIKKNKEKVRE